MAGMTGRSRGSFVALAGLALALLGAEAGATARVVDVRIGQHDDLTRVVIELDAASGHRIERQAGREGAALAVHVGAKADRRKIVSHGPFVGSVSVAPDDGGAVALIALREPGLDYSEMLLDSPPRIVIDVHRATPAHAGSGPAAPARPGPAPARSPEAAQRPPIPAPGDESDSAAAVTAASPGVASLPDANGAAPPPPASYRALVAEQQAREPQAAASAPAQTGSTQAGSAQAGSTQAGSTQIGVVQTGPSRGAAQPGARETATQPSAAASAGPQPAAAATDREAATSPAPAATPAERSEALAGSAPGAIEARRADAGRTGAAGSPPEARAAAAPPVAAGPPAVRDRIRSLDPAPALLGLAVLAGAAIAYRRFSVRRTRRLALAEDEDALAIFGDGAPIEGAAAEAPEPDAEAPESHPVLSLVRPPDEAGAAEPVVPEDAPAQSWQTLSIPLPEPELAALPLEGPHAGAPDASPPEPYVAAPAAAAGPAEEGRVAELSERIATLERRIEELLEARERLERFAAAQNEELRVQRAAIARTQRVLRGMARPEDAGAEAGSQPSLPLSGD